MYNVDTKYSIFSIIKIPCLKLIVAHKKQGEIHNIISSLLYSQKSYKDIRMYSIGTLFHTLKALVQVGGGEKFNDTVDFSMYDVLQYVCMNYNWM
jgi:hypothetical protein